jgi:hypothetical protein
VSTPWHHTIDCLAAHAPPIHGSGVDRSGKTVKDELVEALVDFLEAPKETGRWVAPWRL